jgi:hypothetical protein
MRSWAPMLAALVLVAGCSKTVGGQSQPTRLTPLPGPPSTSTITASVPVLTSAPDPGAPIAEVAGWIAAGEPADAAAFHTATRDGAATDLGDDVAFVTPSGKTRCATYAKFTGALMCLVELKNPPPKPPDFATEWVAGWVDFDGKTLSVGSPHGDPGPFTSGDGPQLPYGSTLKFGDYQCRSDQVGLYCTSNSHESAARYSDAGIEPFGCLQPVTPPPADIGLKFSC